LLSINEKVKGNIKFERVESLA
jgi:hypothetical protein